MHSSMLSALALDAVRERQVRGERLARLLPRPVPAEHGALRRRLTRGVARVARLLDEELPSAPPSSRWA